MLPDAGAPPGMARLGDGTRQHLGLVDEALRVSAFLTGPDPTAADILMAYPFTAFRGLARSFGLVPTSAIEAQVRRLQALPASRRAMAPLRG